jgi:hypothetical protein
LFDALDDDRHVGSPKRREHLLGAGQHENVAQERELQPCPVAELQPNVGHARRREGADRFRRGWRRTLRANVARAAISWAVVVRHGRWYVLCFAHDPDAVRTLRIDRIRSVAPVAETFRSPDDLNPVALLEQHLGTGWPYRVHVVFDAPLAKVQPHVPVRAGRLEALDHTHCTLTGSTNNPSAYAAERLAPIPYPFTVNDGPELREAVTNLATRLTAATT